MHRPRHVPALTSQMGVTDFGGVLWGEVVVVVRILLHIRHCRGCAGLR